MCRNPEVFSPYRRRWLLAVASASLLAACGRPRTHDAAPSAVDFSPDTRCVLDGLRLVDFAGPKAQIHYIGQDTPEFHCDTVEMFHAVLTGARRSLIRAVFVQDTGAIDWRRPRGQWIDAHTAWYVHGSARRGPLGPTLASFAERTDAESFAREYGGRVLRFDEVDADMAVLDGGALHDTRM